MFKELCNKLIGIKTVCKTFRATFVYSHKNSACHLDFCLINCYGLENFIFYLCLKTKLK